MVFSGPSPPGRTVRSPKNGVLTDLKGALETRCPRRARKVPVHKRNHIGTLESSDGSRKVSFGRPAARRQEPVVHVGRGRWPGTKGIPQRTWGVPTGHTQAAVAEAVTSICTEVLARLATSAPGRFARRRDSGNVPAGSPERTPRTTPRPVSKSTVYSAPGGWGPEARGPGHCVKPRLGRDGLRAARTPNMAASTHIGRLGGQAGLVTD